MVRLLFERTVCAESGKAGSLAAVRRVYRFGMRRFGFPQAVRAKSGGAGNVPSAESGRPAAGGTRSDGFATACGRHSAFCAPAADEHVPKRQGHSGEVEKRKEDEQRVDVQAERVRRIIRLQLIVLPPNDVVMAAPEVGRDDEGEQEGDSVLARFVLPAADGAAVRKQQQEQSDGRTPTRRTSST